MKRCIVIFLAAALLLSLLGGCAKAPAEEPIGTNLVPTGSMELQYATQFSVDYYEGGYKLLSLADGSRFLVIPEGKSFPEGIDAVPLYQPVDRVYLAATAVMCLFDGLDRLDAIRLSGTKADGWHIENARAAMEEGKILFAGKYSEPDYEMLLNESCSLAVESTMIGHASEVKDKLEELGIPVLVDQSSNEPHPLGRTEWVKLYGALLNEEEKANALFDVQVQHLNAVSGNPPTGKTVAFFYISSSGRVVARKTGDYVSNMIELAGGDYVFDHLGDQENKLSTVTIEMETFYAAAKDADILIYNSTIGGEVASLGELMEKSELLREFKAVQNGDVWCTGQNMYQEITGLGEMIRSFHSIFSGEADNLDEVPYLYRLKNE